MTIRSQKAQPSRKVCSVFSAALKSRCLIILQHDQISLWFKQRHVITSCWTWVPQTPLLPGEAGAHVVMPTPTWCFPAPCDAGEAAGSVSLPREIKSLGMTVRRRLC